MAKSLSPERVQPLQRAVEQWKRQLVDVSGRNPLLNFRDLKTGTLNLTPELDSYVLKSELDSLIRGRAVLLSSLFPTEEGHAESRRRVSTIHRQAQATLDEKGITTLFVAVGLATWEVENKSLPNSPVVLIPITITPSDAARRDFKLEVSGDPHLNPVLAHVLREEQGVDPLGQGDPAEAASGSLAAMETLLGDLPRKWSRVRGLSIRPRIVLGNFKYTNMPMVADLEGNLDSLGNNDLVAAIAGVEAVGLRTSRPHIRRVLGRPAAPVAQRHGSPAGRQPVVVGLRFPQRPRRRAPARLPPPCWARSRASPRRRCRRRGCDIMRSKRTAKSWTILPEILAFTPRSPCTGSKTINQPTLC